MTDDFIDDFKEYCQREKLFFLIVIGKPGQHVTSTHFNPNNTSHENAMLLYAANQTGLKEGWTL